MMFVDGIDGLTDHFVPPTLYKPFYVIEHNAIVKSVNLHKNIYIAFILKVNFALRIIGVTRLTLADFWRSTMNGAVSSATERALRMKRKQKING